MLQRTTLLTWEYGRIQEHAHLLNLALLGSQTPWIVKIFAHQDDTATRTTKGLVSSRSNDVRILQWVVEQTGCNQTCRVSHINHEESAYLIGNLAHAGVIPLAAVSATTTDNQFWFVLKSQFLHLVVVYTACFLVQVVTDRVVENTGCIDVATMREVAAVVEVQAHEGITWLQYGKQNSSVSLCTRVRLYVGILSTEHLLYTLDGEVLYDVNYLASAIITLAWQPLGILVSKVRTHSVHHLVTHEILRSDKLHTLQLALMFSFD